MLASIILPALTLFTLVAGITIPPVAYKATIHPVGQCGRCLTAVQTVQSHDATTAVVRDCDFNNPNTYWYIADTGTYIMSAGTQQCMAGGVVGSNIWDSNYVTYDGYIPTFMPCPSSNWPSPYTLPAVWHWDHSNPLTFALKGKNFCLDLKDGSTAPDAPVQVWTCYGGNTNQEWTVVKH